MYVHGTLLNSIIYIVIIFVARKKKLDLIVKKLFCQV